MATVHYRPIFDRRSSTASATSCAGQPRGPVPRSSTPQSSDDRTSPLESAIGKQTLESYEAALARLTDDEREAVVTRVELGFSYAEVAEDIGKPSADAARMTVVRALVKLARDMDDDATE